MSAATNPITPEQRAAAAAEAQKKQQKAAAEKTRRENIKTAKAQLVKAGLDEGTKLSPEQRARAVDSAKKKAALGGKGLATYILEGKAGRAVQDEAKAERKAAERADRTRQNVTRSGDPEAAGLAVEAKSLAPEVKSAFLPKDAREFIDSFEVELDNGKAVKVRRTDVKDAEPIVLTVGQLEKFARKGEKDKEVRAELATLGKGTRLWGRKLGLMILATRLRLKGAEAEAATE